MENDLKKLVVKSALRVLDLDNLQTDPSYQRDVKSKHKKIVADFNPDALGIPIVGERGDGTLWIVDGLQRVTALRKLGKVKLRAEVFASTGPEHEAEVFKLVNLGRTRLTAAEEFRALLTSHDESAWTIKNCVEECGLKLVYSKHTSKMGCAGKEVTCLSTLRRVFKEDGLDALRFALTTARDAWPGDPKGFHNSMVSGLAMWFKRHNGLFEPDRLMPRLQTVKAHAVLYAASQATLSNSQTFAVADQIEKLYRKRKPRT